MKNIKFTIITVCYNCKDLVNKTIESLLKQTYKDYEYIIIDGKSSDGTLEEIYRYKEKFQNIKIVSEKDLGIYDAMNKGIKNAAGNYIYFLNMGDSFYNDNVLEIVNREIDNLDDIYYGDYIKGKEFVKSPKKITNLYLLWEKMVCHQAIFAPIKSFEDNLFDISLKYCADRKWLISSLKDKKINVKHINVTISIYDPNGISSNLKKVTDESKIVLKEYYPEVLIKILYIKNLIGNIKRNIKGAKIK